MDEYIINYFIKHGLTTVVAASIVPIILVSIAALFQLTALAIVITISGLLIFGMAMGLNAYVKELVRYNQRGRY